MKETFKLLIIALFFTNSLVHAQERAIVIEPAVAPEIFIYKSFGQFQGTEYSANAMYLITSEGVVLFDVPWQRTQYQDLLDEIKNRHDLPIIGVFATHWHADRAGDLSFFNDRGIKTYATKKTNALLKKGGKATSSEIIVPGESYTIGDKEFVVDFLGEGHTVDNVVVWFPQHKILNGGCLVKSRTATDLGNTAEANLKQWPKTMTRLKSKYSNAIMVIPGHDQWRGGGHVERTIHLLN